MDHAQLLVQSVGYNGFSYADIAQELGIRKATIHYYYRTKSDLCASLLRRYRLRFRIKVESAMAELASPKERLMLYISFYQEALDDGRLCPCGVLTSELLTLSPDIQEEVRGFFDEQLDWIEAQLRAAASAGELRVTTPPRDLAASLLGMIEGGMLLAHARKNRRSLADAIAGTLSLIFS